MILHHIGLSGGKDSTGLLLWALHKSGLPRESIRVTFCDTGNEDPDTYGHISMLERMVIEPAGIVGGLETIIPPLQFFDLAFKKGRFPSKLGQFCTTELKIEPTRRWIRDRWNEGHEVIIINGKRVDESRIRKRTMKDIPERGFSDFWGCLEWAPFRDKSLDYVMGLHREFGIPLNPLYDKGAQRVGCFPCVNCSKTEIRMVAKHRPEKIDRIEFEEQRMEKAQGHACTFFQAKTAILQYRTKTVTRKKDNAEIPIAPIREVVKWAQTARGGRQMILDIDEPRACFIGYHACE